METVRLFVVRHGESQANRQRRFAGWQDVPLSPGGRIQCEAVAAALAAQPIAAVYTSPLERARATAETVAKRHGLPVRVEAAFREMGFGAWEGLTRGEMTARYPDLAEAWRVAPHAVTPPGGEALTDVAARVGAGLAALRRTHAGQTVVVVSHAIVTRLIVLEALGLGPERLWSVDASPAGISEIEYAAAAADGGGWSVVHRMNTRGHLEGEPA